MPNLKTKHTKYDYVYNTHVKLCIKYAFNKSLDHDKIQDDLKSTLV